MEPSREAGKDARLPAAEVGSGVEGETIKAKTLAEGLKGEKMESASDVKKPFYKRGIFILLVIIVVIGIIAIVATKIAEEDLNAAMRELDAERADSSSELADAEASVSKAIASIRSAMADNDNQ